MRKTILTCFTSCADHRADPNHLRSARLTTSSPSRPSHGPSSRRARAQLTPPTSRGDDRRERRSLGHSGRSISLIVRTALLRPHPSPRHLPDRRRRVQRLAPMHVEYSHRREWASGGMRRRGPCTRLTSSGMDGRVRRQGLRACSAFVISVAQTSLRIAHDDHPADPPPSSPSIPRPLASSSLGQDFVYGGGAWGRWYVALINLVWCFEASG